MIAQENQGLVHHILLYGCYDNINREHHFKNNRTAFDCYGNRNMPSDLQQCKAIILGWGLGGGVCCIKSYLH